MVASHLPESLPPRRSVCRSWAALPVLLAVLPTAGVVAAAPAVPAPAKSAAQQPINLEAASSDFDYKNNSLLFRRVKITQGPMTVSALEASATGLNFDDSKWSLKGQVVIIVPDGRLESNAAQVTFRNNEIITAVITGTPASFEQKLRDKDKGQLAKGKAGKIEYNVQAGTVRLNGQAWLTDGQNDIRGETLVYDIGKQRVAANPGATEPGGVRITINPKTPPPGKPTPAKGTTTVSKPPPKESRP